MKRFGMVLRVREDKVDDYVRLHEDVWPEVLDTIARCNLRNYSIFLRRLGDGRTYLFSYFEHDGDDFAADMRAMAADPATRRWWALMEPMQAPWPDRAPGDWWTRMEEVFHHD
jgi:L-rhamnose mutarotase